MTCPVCGGQLIVIDSRPTEDSIHRRRKCVECGYRFSTIEVDADLYASEMDAVKRSTRKAVDTALAAAKKRLYLAFGLDERRG